LNEVVGGRFFRTADIKRRLHVMRAFVDELTRVSRAKPFSIRNDILWNQMLDVRDKLVIDLYSRTVEMRHGMKPLVKGVKPPSMKKRGLFVEIRDNYLASLTRSYAPHPDDNEGEVKRYTKSKAEAFARLFPSCTADSPSAADVEELCERFRLHMVPLGEDRHKNRAHAQEGEAGTVKMMSVPELEALFEYVEDMLQDLSTVSSLAWYAKQDMNNADCKETAADLIDQILLGSVGDVVRLTATRTRDELYARLHEIHDAGEPAEPGDIPELHFNDRQFAPPFEDWPLVLAAHR
jgi:hypothetical protein